MVGWTTMELRLSLTDHVAALMQCLELIWPEGWFDAAQDYIMLWTIIPVGNRPPCTWEPFLVVADVAGQPKSLELKCCNDKCVFPVTFEGPIFDFGVQILMSQYPGNLCQWRATNLRPPKPPIWDGGWFVWPPGGRLPQDLKQWAIAPVPFAHDDRQDDHPDFEQCLDPIKMFIYQDRVTGGPLPPLTHESMCHLTFSRLWCILRFRPGLTLLVLFIPNHLKSLGCQTTQKPHAGLRVNPCHVCVCVSLWSTRVAQTPPLNLKGCSSNTTPSFVPGGVCTMGLRVIPLSKMNENDHVHCSFFTNAKGKDLGSEPYSS